MSSDPDSIAAHYGQRVELFSAEEEQLARQDRQLSHVRVMVFLVVVACFAIGWFAVNIIFPWYLPGIFASIGFVALVTYHDSVERRWQRARHLRLINEQGLARMARAWGQLPASTRRSPDEHLSTATDLDLFGRASLYQLVSCANTPIGRDILRDWFVEPAGCDEIKARQQAVAELTNLEALREELILEGRLLAGDATARFVEWASGPAWLHERPWLIWLCRIVPATGVLAFLLSLARLIPPDVGFVIVLAVVVTNILISVVFSGNVHDIFARVNTRQGEVLRYLTMFRLMYSMPESSGKLAEIKREATERGGGVLRRLRSLQFVMQLANISHSAMLFIFLYLPLQAGLLFDFHVLNLLEKWQRDCGRHASHWFEALGQFESLVSLATLAYDHPDWTFPEVDEAATSIEASGMGHPLLPDAARVNNDVQVGAAGSFLLITGSNMSGKSTLLRSIGVNIVLAQAGGPVCAAKLRLPPIQLATSIRVRDSLEDGVSFYMAELMRLKEIVDQAVAFGDRTDRRLVYLLDEILQGTNSQERRIAVVRVLSHLVKHGAIGAISTHDLDLAASDELVGQFLPVHFRETLHDQDAENPMTFDYKLRDGIATTTNALKLLEIVGLGSDPV
jgi:hypothetical protein